MTKYTWEEINAIIRQPIAVAIARDAAIARADAATARIEMLEEALSWYGERAAGCRRLGSIGDPARHDLDEDGGKRAREALEPKP